MLPKTLSGIHVIMDAAAENHHLHMSNGNRNTQLNTTGYPYRSDNLHMGVFDALSSLYI